MNFKSLTIGISILVFLMISTTVHAQDQPFRFGLKVGGNVGWMKPTSKNIEQNGTGFGYTYGIMGDFNFQEYYSLSTELLVTTFNGGVKHIEPLYYTTTNPDNSKIKDTMNGVTHDYQFQYLQLPVSLKFRTKEIGYITYWAQFGLAPSFLLSARADIGPESLLPTAMQESNPNDIRVNKKTNDEFEFDNFDDDVFFIRVPMIIGGGIEYKLAGNASLYAGVRFENSFTNLFVADDVSSARNNAVCISTGIFF